MKHLFILLLCVAFSSTVYSQDLKLSTKVAGINISSKVFDLDKKTPKTEQETIGKTATKTTHTAIYKTVEYPVYQTKAGKLFIVYKNSKGNWSKKYIPTQQ